MAAVSESSRVPTEAASHTAGVELIFLSERRGGRKELQSALTASHGVAAVIVHPYYRENDRTLLDLFQRQPGDFDEYKRLLAVAVAQYKELGWPLILFESDEALLSSDQILSQMGIDDGKVFVIPTFPGSPEPINGALSDHVQQLYRGGLRKAIVVGSSFFSSKREGRILDSLNSPRIAEQSVFKGCVGRVVTELNQTGVYTIPGVAVFPPRFPTQPVQK